MTKTQNFAIVKTPLENYVSQLTIIIMTYMIFRLVFWLFIAIQFMLLVFHDKIDRYISPRALAVAFALKCVFVVAYIIYTNIAIGLPDPLIVYILGYSFLFLLLLLVWRLYLPKTIRADKTYQMSGLRKTGNNSCNVIGRIEEGKHIFEVLLKLSDEDFYKFDSQGYFDTMGQKKSLFVKLVKRHTDCEQNHYYDAIMRLI